MPIIVADNGFVLGVLCKGVKRNGVVDTAANHCGETRFCLEVVDSKNAVCVG